MQIGFPAAALIWIAVEAKTASEWFGNNVALPVVKTHVETVSGLVDVYKDLAQSQANSSAALQELVREQRETTKLLQQLLHKGAAE